VTGNAPNSSVTTADLCVECLEQIENKSDLDVSHWHCLHESIWSENPAVKVLAWRLLTKLNTESFAQDLLEQLYLTDDLLEWAKSENSADDISNQSTSDTRDVNGTVLNEGDTVSLIKDLEVKGAGFTAKRGTQVKNISLTGDPALIEGKVNGTQIVLKTCFLKKS
jgi:protein PhnA